MNEQECNKINGSEPVFHVEGGQPESPPVQPEAVQAVPLKTGGEPKIENEPQKENQPTKEKKKRKKWPIVLGRIAAVFILLGIGAFIYVNSMLNLLDRTEIAGNPEEPLKVLVGEEELFDEPDTMNAMSSASADFDSIRDLDIAYSPEVRNILLIGSDSRTTSFSGLADSIILVSINQESGKIHLSSLMRAMYVYIPGRDEFNMLNASYAWGGTEMLVDTIETNFRVKIDDHIAINFNNFEKVLNIAGGVDITLTRGEAAYLGYGSAGTYHMNGPQALAYSRLRHLDTDFMRTGRQRRVIEALFRKAGGMNISQLTQMVNEIFPNTNTSMDNLEVLGLVAKMGEISGYDLKQIMLPLECNLEPDPYTTQMYVNRMEMYWFNYRNNVEALWKFVYDKEDVNEVPTIPFAG